MGQLSRLNHLFKIPAGQAANLTSIKMKDFIGNGKSAVICIMKDDVELGSFANQGFFKSSQFQVPGDRQTWITKEQGDAKETVLCILNDLGALDNWLSRSLADSALNGKSYWDISVRGLAAKEKRERLPHVVDQATRENFPNQIWIDDVESPDAAFMALGINKKICQLEGAKL